LSVNHVWGQPQPVSEPCAGARVAGPLHVAARPADAPSAWKPLIGEYENTGVRVKVLENCGTLYVLSGRERYTLIQTAGDVFRITPPGFGSTTAHFSDVGASKRIQLNIGDHFLRQAFGEDSGKSFRIMPLGSPDELRKEALAAQPPRESGKRAPSLVELTKLDSTIKLDIRYANSNNFMGVPFYSEARAFLQRPAAEALVRVNRKLKTYGYGLMIHDAYRPWYVTKMFWDATPNDKKDFVADPAKGSNHNRGSAVDLSLYDLSTGRPVRMPGGYDEMSDRSRPDYPGGTSLERWHRDLLRTAMESEGFLVDKLEWWHFNFRDFKSYPVLNLPFTGYLHPAKLNLNNANPRSVD
jgi:D-alanyl-D-alanine dipeptidase